MEISNGLLSLVECIESLKNDVKKKVKPIFTLRVPPKSRDEAMLSEAERSCHASMCATRSEAHEHTVKSFVQVGGDGAQQQSAEDVMPGMGHDPGAKIFFPGG